MDSWLISTNKFGIFTSGKCNTNNMKFSMSTKYKYYTLLLLFFVPLTEVQMNESSQHLLICHMVNP